MLNADKNKYFKAGRRIGYQRGLEAGYAMAYENFIRELKKMTEHIGPKTFKPLEMVCWSCGTGREKPSTGGKQNNTEDKQSSK